MAGKGKYDAFGRLVEAATESAKRQSGSLPVKPKQQSLPYEKQISVGTTPVDSSFDDPSKLHGLLDGKGGVSSIRDPDEVMAAVRKWLDNPESTVEDLGMGQKSVLKYLNKQDKKLYEKALGKIQNLSEQPKSIQNAVAKLQGQTYKKTGTNTVSKNPQPVPPRAADPVPAPGTESRISDADLKRIQRGEAHMDGGVVVDGPPPKEAELVEAGVNAARKESGVTNPYKQPPGTTRSYTEAIKASKPSSSRPSSVGTSDTSSYTEGVNKAIKTEKLQGNAQSSTKQQVSENQQKFRKNKTGKQFQQISGDEKARVKINAEGDAARADTVNRKTEAALDIILGYVKDTQGGSRITREAILANNSQEKIIEQAKNLLQRFGGRPNTFTAEKFKALVEEVGVQDALKAVQGGLNNSSIATNKGLQAAMREARGDVVVQNNLPKSKRRKTPEQLEQQRKAEAAAAEKQAAADKAREAAEAEVARQNQLQAQRDKQSLPVRAFNNTAEYLKRNYDNGNVRRTVQTGTAFGAGLTGLAWLANALMSESDEERKAREQAELNMYR